MKKFLIVAFIFAAAGITTAGAQTFTAKVGGNKQERERRYAPVYSRGPVGAFVRAGRGNPIQMLNPRAAQKYYGPPQETVVADDVSTAPHRTNRGESPNRFTGVILIGYRW
jgi:hypothetical protein